MKNFLFPRGFNIVGWLLFIPATILGTLIILNIPDYTNKVWGIICDTTAVPIAVALGALFIACSKKRHEDEMMRSIRLSSLMKSLYAYVIILIIGTICINGLAYLNFMGCCLVLLPVIYVIIFCIEIHKYNKMGEDEE